MNPMIQVKIRPDRIDDAEALQRAVEQKARGRSFKSFRIHKRSIDARGQIPYYVLAVELDPEQGSEDALTYPSLHPASDEVYIIGSGPAGYWAALECIQHGLRPIVLERGKDAQTRRRDLRALQQWGIVHPHSNYCFGEGGAGTYSDGKLYTRSHKRGNIKGVLASLVHHGAHSDILVDAHPHIGSNKLPKIIQNVRQTIEDAGGEVRFNHCVTDIHVEDGKLVGLTVNDDKQIATTQVVLATGHSARDIFALFEKNQWALEYKPFAMGVRIEHQQPLINRIQYGEKGSQMELPAASYSLSCQVAERGVFSFCMCPGGLVVPASTSPGELVVNGMSLSRRDSPYANSGTVVEVREKDLLPYQENGALRGMFLQQNLERKIWSEGSGDQAAPAQRLTDFVEKKISTTLPSSSYIPGLYSARMDQLLPNWMVDRLRKAVEVFGKKMRGYYTEDAQIIGLESRTSSPVRIPRSEDGQHPVVEGLFPCGEGAGYAGGILSACMDGERVARWVAAFVDKKKK